MTSYGRATYTKHVEAENIRTTDLESTGTIKWTAFEPALSGGGLNNLAATLATGNDANQQDITNAKDITCATLNYTTLNPAPPETNTLADVLANGNSVGLNDINMNSQDINNCQDLNANVVATTTLSAVNATLGNINWTTFTPPLSSLGYGGLTQVLQVNNDAGGLNMTNVGQLDALSGDFTGLASTQASLQALTCPSADMKDVNLNATVGGTATLDFTGVNAAVDTFIEGEPNNKTVCTNLDLSSTTNVFGVDLDPGFYRWGAVWDRTNTALPGINMHLETDKQSGYRFFQETSESSPYAYTQGSAPFYAETKETTQAVHSRQHVKLSYFVNQYGRGRIYVCLYISTDGGTTKTIMSGSERLVVPQEVVGGVGAANEKRIGQYTVNMIVDGFPTDGTSARIYPGIRTQDESDEGRLVILVGGRPEDNYAISGRNAQVILTGEPVPTKFRIQDGAS
jgi:hypothetical protein